MMTTHPPSGAVAALDRLNDALAEHWDRGDAEAYGELFTDDVDYIPITGIRYQGRVEVVQAHQSLFQGPFRGTTLHGRILDVRSLSPGIAVAHRVGSLRFPGTDGEEGPETIQTLVVVERGGRWQITAFQNTDVQDTVGPPHPPH